LRAKLGLTKPQDGDGALAFDLLARMAEGQADFTLTFRALSSAKPEAARDYFIDPARLDEWLMLWRARLAEDGTTDDARMRSMQAANPAFIPRNHRVEEVIQAAVAGDYAPFHKLGRVLAKPFDAQPENAAYQDPPKDDEVVARTFCGT